MKSVSNHSVANKTLQARLGVIFRRFFRNGAVACSTAAVAWTSGVLESPALAQQSYDQNMQSMQLEFPEQAIGSTQPVADARQIGTAPHADAHNQQVGYLNPAISKSSRRLVHLNWEQFEQKLVELWGQHMQAASENEDGSRIRIWIPSLDESDNQLVIDRTNNAVTFEGPHASAENWDALMTVLDSPIGDDNGTIRLVGMDSAEPATVRKAVALLGVSEDSSGSLGQTLKYVPFRNSARIASAPQRRTPLNSIPFRPSKSAGSTPAALQPQLQPSMQRNLPPANSAKSNTATGNRTRIVAPQPQTKTTNNPIPTRSTASGGANSKKGTPTTPRPRQPIARRPAAGATSNANGSSSPLPVAPKSTNNIAPAQTTQPQPTGRRPKPPAARAPETVISTISLSRQQEETGRRQIIELPEQESLEGNVKIRVLPDLRTIVLVGNAEDVAKVRKLIEQLKTSSSQVLAKSETYQLKNIDSAVAKEILDTTYEANYRTDTGEVSITAIDLSNSLFVVGQEGAQQVISDLIKKLDIAPPEMPEAGTPEAEDFDLGHRVFRLQHMSAVDMALRLQGYFRQGGGDGGFGGEGVVQLQEWIAAIEGPVSLIPDYRSNSLIVKGNKQILATAERLIDELDVAESTGAKHVVKFFDVHNNLASDLAIVLQSAINGQLQGAPQAFTNGENQNQNTGQNNNLGNTNSLSRQPTAVLQLATIDGGTETVRSGVLFDVKVTADNNSNKLMVTGPAESMELVAALIKQLDQIPDAETLIKVFTIVNGDATQLLTTLESIFGGGQNAQTQNNAGGTANLPLQSVSATQGSSLINLRFAVEARTNSIIVSGPEGDLIVVEDLLLRLDEEDLSNRVNRVYRLNNSPADDAATAINSWLDSRQEVIDADPTTANAFTSARRQVVVVPELVSNSLLISATPAYYEELIRIIEDLDRRPPMVKVKVMIAEVNLNKLSELGVEVGIQDSLLFDRGLGLVGFPFNQSAIGNNSDALSLATRELLAGQGLSNLNVGRSNSDLGYGGLVLTAGNESISVLMRALENRSVVRILNTPEISSVDNLQGSVQVGSSVPRIRQAQQNAIGGGVTISTEDVSVGVILSVTPRVTADGMILMTIDAINSSLGAEENGVPVFVSGGQVIRSPLINITQAQTTIMARNGQTVVFSGLIQESVSESKRGTPILSDLPVIGPLFSFEQKVRERKELLIILTPYIQDTDAQVDASNAASMARMHWCEEDVRDVFGKLNNYEYDPEMASGNSPAVYYPDDDPTGVSPVYLPLEENQDGTIQQSVAPIESYPPQSPPSLAPNTNDFGQTSLAPTERFARNFNVAVEQYQPAANTATVQQFSAATSPSKDPNMAAQERLRQIQQENMQRQIQQESLQSRVTQSQYQQPQPAQTQTTVPQQLAYSQPSTERARQANALSRLPRPNTSTNQTVQQYDARRIVEPTKAARDQMNRLQNTQPVANAENNLAAAKRRYLPLQPLGSQASSATADNTAPMARPNGSTLNGELSPPSQLVQANSTIASAATNKTRRLPTVTYAAQAQRQTLPGGGQRVKNPFFDK